MRLPLGVLAGILAGVTAGCGSVPEPVPSGSPPAPATSIAPIASTTPEAETVVPQRLSIPKLGLDAAILPVGIDDKGEVAVPKAKDVGWYRFGPGGEAVAGSIVLAGHVDTAAEGKGAFYRLRDLQPGDAVTLTLPGGQQREFRVTQREQYDKAKIPLERYFARDGPARLTLITCGGPFDREARRYRDNIVVTAEPA